MYEIMKVFSNLSRQSSLEISEKLVKTLFAAIKTRVRSKLRSSEANKSEYRSTSTYRETIIPKQPLISHMSRISNFFFALAMQSALKARDLIKKQRVVAAISTQFLP